MEAINHEYYVSLEVAKQLKEAGFDWEIYDGYIIYENGGGFTTKFQTPHNFNGNNGDLFIDYGGHKEVLSRPTLEVAQRWLREVKGIHITVKPNEASANCKYFVTVIVNDTKWGNVQDDNRKTIMFNTYEEAQEAGIKKALEIILEK